MYKIYSSGKHYVPCKLEVRKLVFRGLGSLHKSNLEFCMRYYVETGNSLNIYARVDKFSGSCVQGMEKYNLICVHMSSPFSGLSEKAAFPSLFLVLWACMHVFQDNVKVKVK